MIEDHDESMIDYLIVVQRIHLAYLGSCINSSMN